MGREAVKRCWTLLMRDLNPTVAVLDFLLQHEEDTGMTFERSEVTHLSDTQMGPCALFYDVNDLQRIVMFLLICLYALNCPELIVTIKS